MLPLRNVEIATDDLYLDPNNPRFADLQDRVQPVPAGRIAEPGVQENALKRILSDRFEVSQLKDSIRTIGFVPVDRLVATPLPQPGKYLVVEGNRRLGAVRGLLQDFKNGEVDLTDTVRESLKKLPVMVIDESHGEEQRDHFARVLQGVRHVSGIRPWGPYQQAQLVEMMLEDGRSEVEICEVIGLPKKRIKTLRRSYHALEQMQADDDFGEKARAPLFSAFDEVIGMRKLRDWLEWNDKQRIFANEDNRKLLYAWLAGTTDEHGTSHPPKLTDPKDIRLLPRLMTDPIAFKRFCDNPGLSFDDAMAGVRSSAKWRNQIQNLLETLSDIPAVDLETADAGDKDLLTRARDLCSAHLKILESAG